MDVDMKNQTEEDNVKAIIPPTNGGGRDRDYDRPTRPRINDHWEPERRRSVSPRRRRRSASPPRRRRRSPSVRRRRRSRTRSLSRSRTRSRSRERKPADTFARSLGGPMNADHEEAVEFAKISKRENRVYVGNLSYDVKYRDLMEFMRGGGWGNFSLFAISLGMFGPRVLFF